MPRPSPARWAAAAALLVGPARAVCPGLYKGTPPENHAPVAEVPKYLKALRKLDIKRVVRDIEALLTDSQDCWPADGGSYAGLFIRLAWHCSGTYRETDGRGGCGGARQRFEPEASWDDNTNLDKARALLAPIKDKYGEGLSWGDLIVTAGTTAIWAGQGPVSQVCFGRMDDPDGSASLDLGPSPQQMSVAPCPVNGQCERPLGSSTVGLIYVNPEGVMAVPDPRPSARNIREVFSRMGFNDSQTVALIGGGHAFGKTHGACPLGAGAPPIASPLAPWMGNCGTGKGPDTFTSGFDGPWTTTPALWSNEFFEYLVKFRWEKHIGPGGHNQWRIVDPPAGLEGLMRLTTDIALLHDQKYHRLVHMYASDIQALERDFAEAWFTLTTNGNGWVRDRRCFPAEQVLGRRQPRPSSGPARAGRATARAAAAAPSAILT